MTVFQKLTPDMIYLETHWEEILERIKWLVLCNLGNDKYLGRITNLMEYLEGMPADHAIQRPILN